MSKTSTYKYFNYASKVLVAFIIVIFSSFINPDANKHLFTGTDLQAKTIKCYPNPAVSYINFDFPDNYISKSYSLQVYSFTGKKMYEANITSAKATLIFSSQFYRGIYVYQLQDKGGKILETGKFQVNR